MAKAPNGVKSETDKERETAGERDERATRRVAFTRFRGLPAALHAV